MDPQDPKDPQNPREGDESGQEDAPQGTPFVPTDGFVSMEGPDIEVPTGGDNPEDGADGLNADDLSFLADVSAGGVDTGKSLADEHLADLKRVTAEYANYRRRTEANKQIERDRAVGDVVGPLLPVLDDLDRAEKHGDLVEGGPMTTIAQKLRAAVERLGLVAYGTVGELFDPAQHEAIFQKPNPEVAGPTVADVVERGYRIGEVTLRAAKVVVDQPE